MWKKKKYYGNENLKGNNPITDYDRYEINRECGVFQIFR
jgi:hypothetical protein